MKRKILIIAVALSLFFGGMAVASGINGSYKGLPIVKVTYEGQELPYGDAPAVIMDNRSVVPLYLLKAAGFNVTWNSSDYSVDISQPRKIVTLADIQRMANCVKKIDIYNSDGTHYGTGTGFISTIDGEVITASHVKGDKGALKFNYNNGYTTNLMDFNDSVKDIAGFKLSKISGHENEAFPYLTISKRVPKVGEPIYSIGYPNGQMSITQGVVKAIVEYGNYSEHVVGIEHTAFTDGGSSGGAILDQYGEVIGVISSGSGTPVSFIGVATSAIYINQLTTN